MAQAGIEISPRKLDASEFPDVDFKGEAKPTIYMLTFDGDGVSISYCPWCGANLEGER